MLVSSWLLGRGRVAVLWGEVAREEETGTHVLQASKAPQLALPPSHAGALSFSKIPFQP